VIIAPSGGTEFFIQRTNLTPVGVRVVFISAYVELDEAMTLVLVIG
jgi:hypothetical protein